MATIAGPVPIPPFVKPIRIPEEVGCQEADPPVARAGETGRWLLRFVLAERVSEGTELGILFHGGRNVKGTWQRLQVDDPSAAGHVSLRRGSGEVIEPLAMADGGTVMFEAPPGGLAQGECLEAQLGGEAGALAPRLSLPSKMFLLFIPLPDEDTSVPKINLDARRRIIGACLIHVIGGDLDHLRVYAPSQAKVGEPFDLLVRGEDEFCNVAADRPGELTVRLGDEVIAVERQTHLEHAACCRLEGIVLREPGVFRPEVEDADRGLQAHANPIRCVEAEPEESVYWGMIHGHTETSDGAGSLDHYYAHMREQCLLDFGATGDHDHVFETSEEMWQMTQEATARHHEPGKFATFLGYEWAKWRRNGDGDRNVYYLQDRRPMYRSDEGHCATPGDLFRALADETAIIVPHHPANIGNHCDWKDHDPEKERLVEIYSEWGNSERSIHDGNPYPMRPARDKPDQIDSGEVPAGFVQRALALGWRVGFTAGGDDHQAHPGDETPRRPPPARLGAGLMAVRAPARTRERIWEGLWGRNCYGTTGARMIVDFSLAGAPMGSELRLADRPELATRRRIAVTVHGTAMIEKIEVVRNNEDAFTHGGSSEDESFEWDDTAAFDEIALPPAPHWPSRFCFYYLRVTQADGQMAWASPIWVSP